MLFNSFAFMVFLPVVFVIYWFVVGRNLKLQNAFVLAASYFFYGWWDWRFLSLLFASSVIDLLLGQGIVRCRTDAQKKWLVTFSILINLTLLGFFKYFNFFIEGMDDLLSMVGFQANLPTLRVILPIGISFYTFQSLGYVIDVYRGHVKPGKDPVTFLAFVSFFPQLVAGPIERAKDLLTQFQRPRVFEIEAANDGLRRMLWGFFKKIVIADNCATISDAIFAGDPATTPGITLFFGAFFFAFQIYGDFSGYSDIAIGCARLFGFKLSQNFNYPYFSRSIPEFWRRWHISLSSWFRDYLYIPLGGYNTKWGRLRNVMITFTVSGFWHGANWTYMAWGALHGTYFIPEKDRAKRPAKVPQLSEFRQIASTFLLVTFAWIFFRATSIHAALDHFKYMVLNIGESLGAIVLYCWRFEMAFILMLIIVEWRSRTDAYAMASMPRALVLRWCIYIFMIYAVVLNINMRSTHEFIYFQF
ncbi:MAG: MBOAT family protein [Flavobacteriales bacterium]|nr:MBOAT family protein [Flavobacteriales bacterium]